MLKDDEVNLSGSDVPEGIARARNLVIDKEKFMANAMSSEELEAIRTRTAHAQIEWYEIKKLVADLARSRPNTEALRVAIAMTHRSIHEDILGSCMAILEALAYQGVDGRNAQAQKRARNLLLGDPVGRSLLDYPRVIREDIDPSCPLVQ